MVSILSRVKYPTDSDALRERLCEVGRRMWLRGYSAGADGNLSVRLADGLLLVTPSSMPKHQLTPGDLVVTNAAGVAIGAHTRGRRPSSEVKLHAAVYEARADVGAVIHAHPPHAVAFCLAGMPLPEGLYPEAEAFLGRVPLAGYGAPSTSDLPREVLAVLGEDTNSVLMANHGTVNFSADLEQTYVLLEMLDSYCRVLLLLRQLGRAQPLDAAQRAQLMRLKAKMGLADPRAGEDGRFDPDFGAMPYMQGLRVVEAKAVETFE